MKMRAASARFESSPDEIANTVTHGIGLIFAMFGLIALLDKVAQLSMPTIALVSVSLYGASMILLYLASTLYHAFRQDQLKYTFKVIDHCAIYGLIAGSYTPFLLISLQTSLATILMGVIWSIALIGMVLKICFVGRWKTFSLCLYLTMGWLSLLVIYQLAQVLPWQGLALLAGGGVAYSVGVYFYVKSQRRFHHAIWHSFVLLGSILHFSAVYGYVLG